MDFRPLSLRQAVRIKSSDLTFPDKLEYESIFYVLVGSSANWKVEYENTLRVPARFSYDQGLNGVVNSDSLRLSPKTVDSVSSFLEITEPKIVSAYARVIIGKKVLDSVSKSFNVGTLHYGEKPISEYPSPEGYNEDLTAMGGYEGLKDRWSAQKGSASVVAKCITEARNGALFKGIHYRPRDGYTSFYTTYEITNKLPTSKDVDITGPVVGVIYDDRLHAAWVGREYRRVTVPANSTGIYTYGQSVPEWLYGTIAVFSVIGVPPPDGGVAIPWSEHKLGTMVPPP